jgi:hypothetical protein
MIPRRDGGTARTLLDLNSRTPRHSLRFRAASATPRGSHMGHTCRLRCASPRQSGPQAGGGLHGTARAHWRRGGNVVARGARAAAREIAHHPPQQRFVAPHRCVSRQSKSRRSAAVSGEAANSDLTTKMILPADITGGNLTSLVAIIGSCTQIGQWPIQIQPRRLKPVLFSLDHG